MSHSASILSKTLQSITVTKIRELEKQRAQYETRKSAVLADADRHLDQGERISCLLGGVRDLYRGGKDNNHNIGVVDNTEMLLAQARYDPSVPAHMLRSCEDLLRSKLDVQSHKLSMAHLYSSLVTEWMNPGEPMEGDGGGGGGGGGSEEQAAEEESSFEVIDRQKERLQSLCDQFEKVVFTPLETDEAEINEYLDSFFDTFEKKKVLETVREHVRKTSEALLQRGRPFNEKTLKQCIKGLLEQDLLSDDKQTMLREFEQNEVVLREIADVLNTRFADLETWDWDAGEEGVPVLPRQQLNGKYRIWMDEDVLQAIFIHYIGIRSCVGLKEALTRVVSGESGPFWRWHAGPSLTEREAQRRAYYLGESITGEPEVARHFTARKITDDESKSRARERGVSLDAPVRTIQAGTIVAHRRDDYIGNFCVAALPSRVDTLNNGLYADEGEQPQDSNDEGGDDDDGYDDRASRWVTGGGNEKPNIKQVLLRTLATEVMVQQALHGQAAVVQSDLKWFGASLSHTSIFAVMRFFGFPENLVAFYRKVLEAPLNLSPSSDSHRAANEPRPRVRRRGMPMARAPEKLIGELVLFVMDMAVNQETGLQLYRLHDDLWVAGDPSHTAEAWGAMRRFARVMGLEFNDKKTGSVYLVNEGVSRDEAVAAELPDGPVGVGHLVLDPESGRWTVDQENVAKHVAQLKKQLAESRSVLDWVRTWNSCTGRFFGHAFGEPACCFGEEHVQSVLETYRKMQRDIFEPWCKTADDDDDDDNDDDDGGTAATSNGGTVGKCSVVGYVKSKIAQRFGVSDVSDAFLLFPDQLGGLGLRNPFIPFLMAREGLKHRYSAAEIVKEHLAMDLEDYDLKKKHFEALGGAREREARAERALGHRFDPADVLGPGEADGFMGLEEYAARRELTSAFFGTVYRCLLKTPPVAQPTTDWEVENTLRRLSIRPESMFAEVEWVLQMYRKEAEERFDGLRLVEKQFLPLGVIAMMRKRAVRWGLVL
ncbi:hypothetical protein CH35J_009042 [Colletotrichum higginsianum]|uniref:Reverse transcriptase n=1 Tax=Colletotrichum higginsianum TaxID=80884 RepID=A0A4T0VNA1_9PEZI|nr:hypothetical protein CH35J_009042 [Colletotrichum higginsianum]